MTRRVDESNRVTFWDLVLFVIGFRWAQRRARRRERRYQREQDEHYWRQTGVVR